MMRGCKVLLEQIGKRCPIASLLLAVGVTAAGTFPYGQDSAMGTCFEARSVAVTSVNLPASVPQVRAMQASDSIVTVRMGETLIRAVEPDEWTSFVSAVGTDIQAGVVLKAENDGTLTWMGFTGGGWVALTGVVPEEGTYDVKVDVDYSLRIDAAGAPKVRYAVRRVEDTEYIALAADGSSNPWLAIGTGGKTVVNGIDLYGRGTSGPVEAKAGARPAEGTVVGVEDVGMNYDRLMLKVAATETWGVDRIVVTLRDRLDGTVRTVVQRLDEAVNGTNTLDFSDGLLAGRTYAYEVRLQGSYDGTTPLVTPSVSADVDMFSTNGWFRFSGTEFVNAEKDANVRVEGGRFYAADAAVAGVITPEGDAPSNVGLVVLSVMDVADDGTGSVSFMGLNGNEPLIAVVLEGTGAARGWRWRANGVWHDGAENLPTGAGTYEGRAVFDRSDEGRVFVSYEIRRTGTDGPFVPLLAGVELTGETALRAIAVGGDSRFSDLEATVRLAAPSPVQPDNARHEIVLNQNAEVSLAALETGQAYTVVRTSGRHLKWKDAAGRYATVNDQGQIEVKSGIPLNGLSSYHSYILGLDAESAQDRPDAVVRSDLEQTLEHGVPVCVPNIRANAESGCTVWLQRMKSTNNGASWQKDGEPVEATDGVLMIPLNTAETPGVLYRVDTLIK